MREILSRIGKGKTIEDLADELGTNKSMLQAMIDFMVERGYLERVNLSACSTCPLSSKCFPEDGSTTKMYTLTLKGAEFISETKSHDW